MKLHTTPGSPTGRKVQAVILHLELDVEVQHYDFFKGELRAPEYPALSVPREREVRSAAEPASSMTRFRRRRSDTWTGRGCFGLH